MNRIFKVVWNKSRGTYTVCDEHKKTHGKTKSVKAAVIAASVAAMMGFCGVAGADPVAKSGTIYSFAGIENNTAIIYENLFEGASLEDNGDGSITVSVDAKDKPVGSYGVLTNMYTSTPSNLDVATSGLNIAGSNFTNVTTNNAGAVVLWNDKDSDAGTTPSSISNSSFTNNQSSYGGGAVSILTFYEGQNPVDLTVTGSTFKENSSKSGGAIFSETKGTEISISGSNFEQNSANTNDGNGGNGGAIYALGTTTTISGESSFIGNSAVVGGAIYNNNGKLDITGSTFKENSAGEMNFGGAIYSSGTLDITSSEFTGNRAGDGGAIYNNGKLDITGSTFTGNSAGNGGAIASAWFSEATIAGSTFTGNSATNGGAILNNNSWGKKTTTITSSTFSGNSATGGKADNAGNGGAIYNFGGKLSITGSEFAENSATDGGAILNNSEMTVANSTFTGNIANGVGGAIGAAAAGEGVKTTISGSTFKDNHAIGDGGAIGNYGELSITSSTFEGNTAQLDQDENGNWTKAVEDSIPVGGGAISLGAISSSKVGTITDTTFTNNVSGKNGGAIGTRLGKDADNSAAKLDIEATFSGNKAYENGGAIYNTFYADNGLGKGDGVTVKGEFTGNTAGQNGGAIYNDGATDKGGNTGGVMTLTDSTFTNNSATKDGGAIYNSENAQITFNGTNTFSGNTAGENKNDIYNAGTITIASGTTTLDGGITGTGKVDINGGKLVSPTINGENAITLTSGTLQTGSDQVMTTAAFDKEKGTVADSAGSLKEGANVTYTGGELALTDAKYNLKYAQSVATAINNNGKTAVTMLGELDDSSIEKTEDGSVKISDLDGIGVVMAQENLVTDDTTKGLVIGTNSTDGLGETYKDAQTSNGSLGAQTLTLENEGSAVLVTNSKELTLVGAGEGQDLVKTDATVDKVTLDIGTDSAGGTLNLGTDAQTKTSGGTLTGDINVAGQGTVNVKGAEYKVTGTIAADGGVVNVSDSAKLDAGTVNVTNSGTVNVAGTMSANELNVTGSGTDTATTVNVSDSAKLDAGTVNVTNSGTVNVAGTMSANELNVTGTNSGTTTVNVGTDAALKADTVTLTGGTDAKTTVEVAGALEAGTLTAAAGTTINVGDSTSAGNLTVGELSLNGATLFLDPVWEDGADIGGASQAAVSFDGNEIDGKLVVGQNSLAVLGDTSTDWAEDQFALSRKTWGEQGITAALAIRTAQTLDSSTGAIVVDGSKTTANFVPGDVTENTVTFAANSMLIVDAAGIDGNAAITGDSTSSTATVADSAALHIANATNNQKIVVLKDFNTINNGAEAVTGWQGNNLTSSDAMIKLSVAEGDAGTDGHFTVSAAANSAAAIFPDAMPLNTMDAIWQGGLNNVDGNGGIAFLSRAADSRYLNHQDAARTINGAAKMAVAAGVQLSNLQALDSVTDAVENHISLTGNTRQANSPRLHDEGADLWAALLYRHDSGDGMKSGGYNSDIINNYGGIIVGSDYTWKLEGDAQTRVGAALSIGKGDSHSDGDYNHSKNDYDTYGINLYGSWNNKNINIMADIGYMKGDNEVEQQLSQSLGGKLKADVDTEMWTAGIKGEYRIETGAVDIIPHVGVRYTHLKTDSFSSRNTLGTVFETDSENYNIWQLPLGVTLSKDYKSQSGWTIKPKFDLSVIGAAGDTEAETRVRVPGVNAADSEKADMMDSVSFRGIVGLEMQKDATSVGLSAGYQHSATMNSAGFMLNIGHHF